MHRLTTPLAIALFVLAGEGQAQERNENDCLRLNPGITSPVEMATCTSGLAGSKRALNKAYADLRRHIPAEHRPSLDEAQRAWIAHRNAQCRWEAGGYPGNTGNSASIIGCTADMNRERTKYLNDDRKERW